MKLKEFEKEILKLKEKYNNLENMEIIWDSCYAGEVETVSVDEYNDEQFIKLT